jgi:type II secretory pathway pseudopilin PulG
MRTGRQAGYAYVLLLAAIAVISVVASASVAPGAAASRRDAERHLLAIGGEFERAFASYRRAGMQPGPRTMDELLRDPRVPGVRRHLRQLYADPLTGRDDWVVIRDPQGFITGVHSRADGWRDQVFGAK